MEYKDLHAYVTIGETGSIKEAIQVLKTSASQLTKSMDRVEAELGRELFGTYGRRKVLNSDGQLFLKAAKKIVKLQDEYMRSVHVLAQGGRDQLSIGLMSVASAYDVVPDIHAFQKQNPEIEIHIIQESQNGMLEYLLDMGQIDAIFTTSPVLKGQAGRESMVYCRDSFKIVLPLSYPVENAQGLPISKLKDENFLMFNEASMQYKATVNACREAGFIPHISGYFSQADTIMKLIQMGEGVSILMETAMKRYISFGGIKVVDPEPAMPIEMYMIWRREKSENKSIRAFKEFLEQKQIAAEHAEGRKG